MHKRGSPVNGGTPGMRPMSIINEALKKTQAELTAKGSPLSEPAHKKEIKPLKMPLPTTVRPKATAPPFLFINLPRREGPREKITIFITLFLGILLLIEIVIFLNQIFNSAISTRHKKAATIIINGVMIKENKTVALINNEVYEVGETINGMKIVNITLDRIDFKYRGRVKSFKVQKKQE